SGAVGTVSAACCLDWKHRAGLELHADGLSIAIHEDRVIATTAQGPVEHGLAPDDAKLAADRAFIDAVVGNGTAREGILVDYDEALRTHQLACAIADSAAHGRPVRLHD
ncbi:MAG: gfo/Idh/MocA family oxidoreductase, partial [Mycolicibacterium sp.]|nr:gfo/Idh/MocA family oxidoreductase [Mycolicibacterium sp.]